MNKPMDLTAIDQAWHDRAEAGLRITQGVMYDDLMQMPVGYVLTLQARVVELGAALNRCIGLAELLKIYAGDRLLDQAGIDTEIAQARAALAKEA